MKRDPKNLEAGVSKVPRASATNSRKTRVLPIFEWLEKTGNGDWPNRLVNLADGLSAKIRPGRIVGLHFRKELQVPPSTRRLAWMIRNPSLLAAADGKQWREYERRVLRNPHRGEFLKNLDRGQVAGLPREAQKMILEGRTCGDCIVETEGAIIWIEGKRNDWLSPGTKWDITRDQLARNLEAASILAAPGRKEFCLIICHEFGLKHHKQLLVNGYRNRTWVGGWPHLDQATRDIFSQRIGTIRWNAFVEEWPGLRAVRELQDLSS
jgi:hypothetical protein